MGGGRRLVFERMRTKITMPPTRIGLVAGGISRDRLPICRLTTMVYGTKVGNKIPIDIIYTIM